MKKEYLIEGIHCEGCISRIKNALKDIEGIKKFDISLKNKVLKVTVKEESTFKLIEEKIQELGFEIK